MDRLWSGFEWPRPTSRPAAWAGDAAEGLAICAGLVLVYGLLALNELLTTVQQRSPAPLARER
ncbi:MAG: hypothetical protein ABR599_06745 [Gemmatimonadota bacterium]